MARVTPSLVALLLVAPALALVSFAPSAAADPSVTHVRIRSFDNTFLDATVFVPEGATANSTPFILMTHGWAGSRVTTPTGRVAEFLDAGYGVLTWDSRGFGASGGEVMLNSPDFEVKDVSSIINWALRNVPQLKRDEMRDPFIGMSGVSYAGGIQLLAAAFDDRIDAIAPEITWHDLAESLAPNGVPKLAWTTALFGAGQVTSCSDGAGIGFNNRVTTGCQTNDLARFYTLVHATNSVPAEVRDALLYRSPKTYMSQIDIPTLLIQGFPDTLFDVNQAVANYEGIKANGAPAKLWLYDGGHALPGTSLPNTQSALIGEVVVAWMDRYVKGDTTVDTGPDVEYYLGGAWQGASAWPVGVETVRNAGGIPAIVSGPVTGGAQASAAAFVAAGPVSTIGPAHVAFDVSGLGVETQIYLSLAVQTGATLARIDGQVQPIRSALGFEETRLEVDLVSVAASVPAGSNLVLVFSTNEPFGYDGARTPALVNINDIVMTYHRS